MCIKCHEIKLFTDFYKNNVWASQSYCDAWCKECAQKYCTTKENTREYFWYNNRKWSDQLWERACKKAEYTAVNDQRYLSASAKKRTVILEELSSRAALGLMNMTGNYSYSDNVSDDGSFSEFNPESSAGTGDIPLPGADPEDTEKIYSSDWNGWYTKREIEYMDSYYAELEEDFE